jgi:hypothetical protein
MPFFPPLKSFYKKRYLYLFAGLFTTLINSLFTTLILKYFLIHKYGNDFDMALKNNYNGVSGVFDTLQWFSLLFYPVLFVIGFVIYFLIPKAKKETRVSILIYLLTVFLIFIYTWLFLNSVLFYILPLLMIIGFLASYRGGLQEAQRIFFLLFIALATSYGANVLAIMICY